MSKNVSKQKRARVRALTNGHCGYCGRKLHHKWHVDHVVPQAHGGSSSIDNLLPACHRCNLSKGAKDPEDFRSRFFEYAAEETYKLVLDRLDWMHGGIDPTQAEQLLGQLHEFCILLGWTSLEFYFEQEDICVPEWEALWSGDDE